MRERLERLLTGFTALVSPSAPPVPPLVPRFRILLSEFQERRVRAEDAEQKRAADAKARFGIHLQNYREALERYRQGQEEVADDFNLLDVMQLTGKEIRHSMVLAWLLDHDLRRLGTHAQGNLGFRLFIAEFPECGLLPEYSKCKYWVRREVAGDDSIVDIEIACRNRFLIHIENKIWSSEGTDQTDREWSDMQRRARELNVPVPHIHALFLTPQGAKPTNAHFRAISWSRVVRVLEAFANQAKPPDVKLFTRHYARGLRRFVVTQDRSETDGEGTTE